MAEKVGAAQAKAQLSALMAAVAHAGKRFVIERRGKPLAALVSVDELERIEQGEATADRPRGALALLGIWRDVDDATLDALVADIYARRESDRGRPVSLAE